MEDEELGRALACLRATAHAVRHASLPRCAAWTAPRGAPRVKAARAHELQEGGLLLAHPAQGLAMRSLRSMQGVGGTVRPDDQ